MILDLPTSTAMRVDDVGSGNELYIVQNTPLEALLFDRNIIGIEFKKTCLASTELLLSHLSDELRDERSLSELVILSKGLAYQVNEAFTTVIGTNLPMNLISTRRAKVVDDIDVEIEVSYSRIDSPTTSLIIGDTIASGATIVSALESYGANRPIHSVFLLSFAGSLIGAKRISEYCASRGIKLKVLYGLAAFGLAQNGFDLSFLDPGTITDDRHRSRCLKQFDGQPVSAVGWDFGSQWMAPEKYRQLCWMEAEKWGLHGHPSLALETRPLDNSLIEGERAAFG
jgi:hypothetical protein